jgi:hypothetical protein
LFGRKVGVSKEKSVVLEGDMIGSDIGRCPRDMQGRTHGIEKSFDFSKLGRRQIPRINADDFPAKLRELGGIS